MKFVDTNYYLRFLLSDNPDQYEKAKQLFFEGVEGKHALFTSVVVLFEVYWVLKSFYKKEKNELIILMNKLLQLKFIEFPENIILKQAITLFAKNNFSLEDCYNLVYADMHQTKAFMTFDRKLSKYFKSH